MAFELGEEYRNIYSTEPCQCNNNVLGQFAEGGRFGACGAAPS